jgi:hypothetical protein
MFVVYWTTSNDIAIVSEGENMKERRKGMLARQKRQKPSYLLAPSWLKTVSEFA